jgi:NADH dehydrogenase
MPQVNCVGTFDRLGRNNFKAVQEDGAARIARLSAANGVQSLVHISSLASASLSESEYAQSKRAGEEAVLRHMPQAVYF